MTDSKGRLEQGKVMAKSPTQSTATNNVKWSHLCSYFILHTQKRGCDTTINNFSIHSLLHFSSWSLLCFCLVLGFWIFQHCTRRWSVSENQDGRDWELRQRAKQKPEVFSSKPGFLGFLHIRLFEIPVSHFQDRSK